MSSESTTKTITVAALLCLVCSILVSTAAVQLRPLQEKNKQLETQRNILQAAGLLTAKTNVEEVFQHIEPRLVDLETGEYYEGISAQSYDMFKAAENPKTRVEIPENQDLGKLGVRARYARVYLYRPEQTVKTIILPVYGKGVWSTMYAFLAIANDGNTVRGLSFYEHGETPGLGGEVDNPAWKSQWSGKKIVNAQGQLALTILKGQVEETSPAAIHQVDGLAGATLTTVGVRNFVHYWLGENGYGPYLKKLRSRGE